MYLPTFLNFDAGIFFSGSPAVGLGRGRAQRNWGECKRHWKTLLLRGCFASSGGVSYWQIALCIVFQSPTVRGAILRSRINRACFKFFTFRLMFSRNPESFQRGRFRHVCQRLEILAPMWETWQVYVLILWATFSFRFSGIKSQKIESDQNDRSTQGQC